MTFPDNFLRMRTAVIDNKDVWINTYLYIGCDFKWDTRGTDCDPDSDVPFHVNNIYGFWSRWVSNSPDPAANSKMPYLIALSGYHILEHL